MDVGGIVRSTTCCGQLAGSTSTIYRRIHSCSSTVYYLPPHSDYLTTIYMQVLLTLNASPNDPPISIIARLSSSVTPRLVTQDTDPQDTRTIVAIRQGRHFLTTFHPELTRDDRFHDYFVR